MLNDYKGEIPRNVLPPEDMKKAEFKKPFYKSWRFYLGVGFLAIGAFSAISGFVMGTRYVQAVKDAAQIIADDSKEVQSESLAPNTLGIYVPGQTAMENKMDFTGYVPYFWGSANECLMDLQTHTAIPAVGSNNPLVMKVEYMTTYLVVSVQSYNHILNMTDYQVGILFDGQTLNPYQPIDAYRGYYRSFSLSGRENVAIPYQVTLVTKPYDYGYNEGVAQASEYVEDQVYEDGYNAGMADGYANGYDAGKLVGGGNQLLAGMFVNAFQQPFNQLYRFLNFNLLGINFMALFTALVSVGIGVWVIKKVI